MITLFQRRIEQVVPRGTLYFNILVSLADTIEYSAPRHLTRLEKEAAIEFNRNRAGTGSQSASCGSSWRPKRGNCGSSTSETARNLSQALATLNIVTRASVATATQKAIGWDTPRKTITADAAIIEQ